MDIASNLNDVKDINIENVRLAIEPEFIYNNWETQEAFFKEFDVFSTNQQKRDHFMKKYGQKYKEQYGELPKLILV